MSSVSPFPATPVTQHTPQPMRAASTAWRITATLPVASKVKSAPKPSVIPRTRSTASGPPTKVSVAPVARGGLEPVLGEVDADDPLRVLETAPGHGAEADHPGAEDDAGR